MLARRIRLSKGDDLSAILKSGATAKSRCLVARYRLNQLDHHRINAIVSPKIGRKAVDRNRIKRQLSAIIRENEAQLPQTNHFDILILPKTAIIGTTYADIKADFLKLVSHLR